MFILAAPVSALGQQTEPSQAGLRAPSKAGDASAGDALTSPPASATQAAAPAIAPEESRAPDRLTSLDPADRAIAERIRDLLATKPNRIFADEKAHAAVEAFYQKRNLAPLWLDKGVENARGKAVIARLKNADADGLDPADYKTPTFAGLSPDALAEAELSAHADRAHLCAACAGRTCSPSSGQRGQHRAAATRARSGRGAGGRRRGRRCRQRARSVQPAVRDTIRSSRRRWRSCAAGPPAGSRRDRQRVRCSPSTASARWKMPACRNCASVLVFPARRPICAMMRSSLEAVKEFQRGNDLPATGNLDARTVKKLNPTNDSRIDTIIANMERWRWYHRDIRKSRVEVNEPDFTLKVIHDGRQVWTSRVVIGKPSMPSPLLAQQMDSITINPTWKVPASIVRNEYLPAEAREPGALARMGMRVKRVNGEVEITMPPGGKNPLGHIRFNFFNRLTVFQHDTPDQYLFAHVVRAESHGCMRVQDAPKYAEVLAGMVHPEEQWTAEKVKSFYAGGTEQEISLGSGPIWIYWTYQTAFVDDAGKLQIRRDLYNLDSRTLAAIKGAREIANPASESKSEPTMATPAPAAPAHRRKAAPPMNHARS